MKIKLPGKKSLFSLAAVVTVPTTAVTTAIVLSDKNEHQKRNIFSDHVAVDRMYSSTRELWQLGQAAQLMDYKFKTRTMGDYKTKDLQDDFGISLPENAVNIDWIVWFDYRLIPESNILVCDYQFKIPGKDKIYDGIMRIQPQTAYKKRTQEIDKIYWTFNMTADKSQEQRFDNPSAAKEAVDHEVEYIDVFALKGDNGEFFETKTEALEKLAHKIEITSRAIATVDLPTPDDGPEGFDSTGIADAGSNKGYVYNGKAYATEALAAAAWVKDHPNKVEEIKGKAVATFNNDGMEYSIELGEFDFGSDPTVQSVASRVEWHRIDGSPSTGRSDIPAVATRAFIYIDGQRITLTKSDGTSISQNDYSVTTTQDGTPTTNTYNHVASFQIDGQAVTAVREGSNPAPISQSDIHLRTIVEGIAPAKAQRSLAAFEIDGQTIVASREDGLPIEQSDISPIVDVYGRVTSIQKMRVASFEIDGQKVYIRKVNDGRPLTTFDFTLSATAREVMPTAAVKTEVTFNVNGVAVKAWREDGKPINESDLSLRTVAAGKAPVSVQSVSEITLADGEKFKIGSTSATPVTKEDLFVRELTSYTEVDGHKTHDQIISITPAHGRTDIVIPQRIVELNTTRNLPISGMIKSIATLTGVTQLGEHQEVAILAEPGIILNKEDVSLPTPAATVAPSLTNFTVTHVGAPANPGRGCIITVMPRTSAILVENNKITYRSPLNTPPLFGQYMANRMYIRNFKDEGIKDVINGDKQRVRLESSEGVHLSKTNIEFNQPGYPVPVEHLISRFNLHPGKPEQPGRRQVVEITASSGIKLSTNTISYRTRADNIENPVIDHFNENDSKSTHFGVHQIISIQTRNGVVADKHSITFSQSGVSRTEQQIKANDNMILLLGKEAVPGVREVGYDEYELWLDGHTVLDANTGQKIITMRNYTNYNLKMKGVKVNPIPVTEDEAGLAVLKIRSAAEAVPNTPADIGNSVLSIFSDFTDAAAASITAAGATGVTDAPSLHETNTVNIFNIKGDPTHSFKTVAEVREYIKNAKQSEVLITKSTTKLWLIHDHSTVFESREDAYHRLISQIQVRETIEVEGDRK